MLEGGVNTEVVEVREEEGEVGVIGLFYALLPVGWIVID